MAVQYMKHEDNGYHVAYNQTEVKALTKAGWKKVADINKEWKAARAVKAKEALQAIADMDKDDAPATN